MTEILTLANARCRARIVPTLGGGLASLEVPGPVGAQDILRRWNGDTTNPFSLACNVLAPFSNRIAGGGFAFEGRVHRIAPNLDVEPLPIHGDAFQRQWAVSSLTEDSATLALERGSIGPFRYRADLDYALLADGLAIRLRLRNTGPDTLPFGGGFHPWFPRRADTRLKFRAVGIWEEDTRHLPARHLPLAAAPAFDFSDACPLPAEWINNAFTGWTGPAEISHGGLAPAVRVTGGAGLDVAILYSPGAEADFFCFEPVSHSVDAINLAGQPGLVPLEPGAGTSFEMQLAWTVADADRIGSA